MNPPYPPRPVRVLQFSIVNTDPDGSRREWSVQLAPAAALLALAAFAVVRFASRPAPSSSPAVVAASAPAEAEPARILGAGAPGHPHGQSAEVITPLTVRDPAALVMPPSTASAR